MTLDSGIKETFKWVRALEAVQRLANIKKPFTGSAGVPQAKLLESIPWPFFIHAGEMPALPEGYSPRNLKYMRAFAEARPEVEFVQEALAQLSWHHQIALKTKSMQALGGKA
jgi:hypothetical protein